MALVSNVCEKVAVPHEDGQYLVLRKLSWKQLERAREARADVGVGKMRAMGGEIVSALRDTKITASDLETAAKDPLNDYDRGSLLRAGVSSWSYAPTVSQESLEDLDDATADWAARAIVRLSKPEETAADRKNG